MATWQNYPTVRTEPGRAFALPSDGEGPLGRTSVMGNPALERRQRAWERFFATGEIEADDVSDVIARSWRRCREAGLDPQAPKVPVRQNQDELADTVRRNGPYIEAALRFMRFLESAVRGSGYILVLTDSAGIVLEVFGDDDVISRARQNNYVPGC